MKKFRSSAFSYQANTKTFITEASDLGRVGEDLFERIYPDACDEGLVIISDKTNTEMVFFLADTETDPEGDTTAWHLRLTPECVRRRPDLADMRVVIFND